jgi:hypothetical protein
MRRNRIKAWISLLLILALAMGCIGARAETPRKKVTVMVYMSGADLELKARAGSRVISQMYATRFNQDEVNVIVLCGGSPKWYSGLSTEALSVVDVGKGERRSLFVAEELPQANMGEPETLTAFLNLCAEKYPAETYDLVLWNHGGGPLYGVCGDYLHGEDYLTTQEMIQALSGSVLGEKGIDLIAMHACLMGSAEFAYAVAPYAKYYIASEDSQFGLDYGWLSGIESAAPLETAKKMVDDSFAFNSEVIEKQAESETNSFAVLDLSKMQAVREAVELIHGGVEDGVVGQEGDLGAAVVAGTEHFHGVERLAVGVFLDEVEPVAEDLGGEVLGEGVHAGDADAVQTAGDLVGVLVELAARVQHGHDDLQGGAFLLRMHVGGNAAPVVEHADGVAFQYLDFDIVAESGEGLVDGVVHHLVHQVVQTAVAYVADIHGGTLPHGLKSFQNLDITRTIGFFLLNLIF